MPNRSPGSLPTRRERASARRYRPSPPAGRHAASAVLRGLAAAIFVTGWLGAAIVLARAADTGDADAVEYQLRGGHVYALSLAESQREKLVVQKMGGDFGVWLAGVDSRLHSLLRPPDLAWTLLVLSTALAAACLRVAQLSDEDVED